MLKLRARPYPWDNLVPVTAISGDTGSPAAVLRARAWLDNCISKHGLDCQQTKDCRLPTRVVQIDGPRTIKQYISSNEPATYASLNDCWGNTLGRTTEVISGGRILHLWAWLETSLG
jgi:hypothetical protein